MQNLVTNTFIAEFCSERTQLSITNVRNYFMVGIKLRYIKSSQKRQKERSKRRKLINGVKDEEERKKYEEKLKESLNDINDLDDMDIYSMVLKKQCDEQ